MPKIMFIDPSGSTHEVEADEGASVMRAGLLGGVQGIVAECGGECSCATCHVYVDENWTDKTGEPSLDEEDMLEFTESERKPTSRLSCQIEVSEELDGLIVNLPEEQ